MNSITGLCKARSPLALMLRLPSTELMRRVMAWDGCFNNDTPPSVSRKKYYYALVISTPYHYLTAPIQVKLLTGSLCITSAKVWKNKSSAHLTHLHCCYGAVTTLTQPGEAQTHDLHSLPLKHTLRRCDGRTFCGSPAHSLGLFQHFSQ